MEKCPCNSDKTYSTCCQPLHDYTHHASNAEQLMCSRFSAFCLGKVHYLIDTLHPDNRQANDEAILRQTIESTHWLGLKIIKHKQFEVTATVEFAAFYQDMPVGQLHEVSRFSRYENRWFYTDGDILPPIKLSRNEVCFCGSGKKIKQCHSN